MQINLRGAEFSCRRYRTLQQFSSDALPTVGLKNSHAPDFRAVAASNQARCSYRSRRDKRQEMHRSPVIAIKLDAFRHALLLDEDAQANRQGLRHLSI